MILEKSGRGKHSRFLPFVFTEQGDAMLSSVLKSKRAIAISILIMRIFTKMRQMIAGYKELLEKINQLEAKYSDSNHHIENIYSIIKELVEPAIKERKPIGFKVKR